MPVLKKSLSNEASWREDIAMLLLPYIRERIHVWSDIAALVAEGEVIYFFDRPVLSRELLPNKKSSNTEALTHLKHVASILEESAANDFSASAVKSMLWDYAGQKGRGAVLWPLRYALSGREHSADPFFISAVLGKEETLARISAAVQILE